MSTIDFKKLPTCVGIIGSRSFANSSQSDMAMYKEVSRFVLKLQKDTEVVSGGAKGVDSYAEDMVYVRGLRKTIYRVDKSLKRGRTEILKEIHSRNTKVVQHVYRQQGVLVAFMDENAHNGTLSTITKARKLDVPVIEFMYTSRGKFLFSRIPKEYLKETL